MEKSRKGQLRKLLTKKIEETTDRIRALRASLAASNDADDSGVADVQLIDFHCSQRNVLEEAVSALENGRYGQCIECEKEIALARLEAVPGANRCRQCQDAVDSKMSRRFDSSRIPFYCPPQR